MYTYLWRSGVDDLTDKGVEWRPTVSVELAQYTSLKGIR